MPYHFTTQHKQGQNTRKLETNFGVRTKKTIHRLRHNDKNKLVQGDP